MSHARSIVRSISAFVGLLCCATGAAAAWHDPALRFQALLTEHFVIYYHQGEEPLAARLAAIAEETWIALRPRLGVTPPRRTHVVLVDETELANGSATPVPYDTIVVAASWPAGSEFIGNTSDWLRIVFTHEFTHIVHLDRSVGWARVVRGVFGRTELAFPNLFLPAWQIEGLATYEESVLTGEGRLHAGDFQAIVNEAARERRLEPLDRANGGLTDWPNGLAQYAYGVDFHAYLANRFGAETLATLARQTAGRVPYTASPVFKRVFGRSLGDLWRDFEATLSGRAGDAAARPARRLTHEGFTVMGPRYVSGADARVREVVYSVRNPNGFPALMRLPLDGSAPVRLATRYLGSTVGVGPSVLVFDQQERRRNAGLYSDLYTIDRNTGRTDRLTSEARLLDPDLSPGGRTIVAVQSARGRRDLVSIDLQFLKAPAAITKLVTEPETQFNAPRWSPDGHLIAVERHRLGSRPDVVIVDPARRTMRVLAASAGARVVTPTWRPDGRAVVAAADLNGGPFQLYEFSVDGTTPPIQLTGTAGGATWPDVSPDGRTIVFVGYTADGFDLFEMDYPTSPPLAPVPPSAFGPVPGDAPGTAPGKRPEMAAATGYSPWPTLKPTSWFPIGEFDRNQVRLGAGTAGADVLGYHGYALSATWLVSGPGEVTSPLNHAPDWQAAYTYARWRPALWTAASSDTSFFAGPGTDEPNGGVPLAIVRRQRQFEAGVLFPVRHVRVQHVTSMSFLRGTDRFTLPDRDVSQTRAAGRAAWAINSAHVYGYSISPEGGAALGATAELVRESLGASADATSLTADGRLYLPGLAPHHVVAVRVAGGTASGDPVLRQTFHLGGGSPNAATVDFSEDAISLLRGFPPDSFAGRHVALLNADYRWPIARPQRGAGTWPLLVHTVHAATFVDAGHTWNRTFRAHDLRYSAGAELSADVVLGYFFPLTATVGAAWGHDGSGAVADRATVYVRLGRAF